MNRKKITVSAMAMACVWAAALFAGAEGNAPETMEFTEEAHLIPEVGETYDAAKILEFTGDSYDASVVYSSYDDSVAEVSEDGIITATGCGVTTIVVSSAVDETVSASIDIAVFDVYGTYTGTKTIEAMGCDITIDLTLNDDGTFTYYRAPMNVKLDGGGEMDGLEDEGTYEIDGTEFTFKAEYLGEYTADFSLDDEDGVLSGKLPTGGADTEMKLVKEAEEETEDESGTEEETGSEEETGTEEETASEEETK